MPLRISAALGVESDILEATGAFNGFVDIDALFHVDPHLLESSSAPELEGAHQHFLAHFTKVMALLRHSDTPGNPLYRQAVRMLTFREMPRMALGYSSGTTAGSGIGKGLAVRLAATAKAIVDAGVEDPEIFELVGLFEEGIGADRISDMTIEIIFPHLLRFSERVAHEIAVKTQHVQEAGNKYALPVIRGRPLELVPRDILRDLPIAADWSDIDTVCAHNAGVRRRVNERIGTSWRYATTRVRKASLKATLLRHPEALRDLLSQYKAKEAKQYDFGKDRAGELVWHDIAKNYADEFPFDAPIAEVGGPADVAATVRAICEQFADLLELNGLAAMLYTDEGKLRPERYAQLLFYGIADAYCEANGLDLNREPNAGRGPVDFKVSYGYQARVTVEIKYSSNTHLFRGYSTQLPIYDAAERSQYSYYVIIRTTASAVSIKKVQELRSKAEAAGQRAPEVIVADGRRKPSASRRQ